MSSETQPDTTANPQAAWSLLSAQQRRVLGTLMEKSKTTPDTYPMTFSGLVTGCNQKTNRFPISNYSVELIERIVDELRKVGAVTLVHGSGRVEKVRHYAYQWLGISKVESAVMTELLLRGHQTLGELRTRASRLEPINDLGELQTLLEQLETRKLVVFLTPPGRGQIVSHNLYEEWELEELKQRLATEHPRGGASDDEDLDSSIASSSPRPVTSANHSSNSTEIAELRSLVAQLTQRVAYLEKELGIVATESSS